MSNFLQASVPQDAIDRARRGSRDAQSVVYQSLAPAVYGLARRLLNSTPLAEEVTQDVFVEVLTQLHRYRGDGAFGAWVRGIAVNRTLSALRRLRVEQTYAEFAHADRSQIVEETADAATTMPVARMLAGLDAESRAVVWLFIVEGMTHAEIAERLGHTTSYSKSRLARALQRLRGLHANGGVVNGDAR